jgi:hypothetical protein
VNKTLPSRTQRARPTPSKYTPFAVPTEAQARKIGIQTDWYNSRKMTWGGCRLITHHNNRRERIENRPALLPKNVMPRMRRRGKMRPRPARTEGERLAVVASPGGGARDVELNARNRPRRCIRPRYRWTTLPMYRP